LSVTKNSRMDNNENDVFDEFPYWLNGPIIMTISVMGIFFNLLTIYILFKTKLLNRMTPLNSQKFLSNRGEHEPVKKIISISSNKRPRIYIYFVCLIFCDILLLISIFLNYSVPTLFDCFSNFYARLIPIW
jgi:hypothetical protein